jgi:predicted transposase/invertase (TIGR01784 family)
MLTYATSLRNLKIGEKIYNFIEQVLNDKQDIIMTYGQKLMKEGRKEGEQKGRKETRLEIAKGMRSAGYKADDIAKLTGLPLSEINNY